MLTYEHFKKAESEALDISRRNGGAPMAIVRRAEPRGWWDRWNSKPYAVVLLTRDLNPTDIIVAGIRAQLI